MKTKLLPKGMVARPALRPDQSALINKSRAPAKGAFDLHVNVSGAWLLEGPAAYMNARGFDVMNAILEGQDQVFDQLAVRRPQSDWTHCVIRRLEMDYSEWCNGRAGVPLASEVSDE